VSLELVQVHVGLRQPLVVFRPQAVGQRAVEARDALAQRERLRPRVALELLAQRGQPPGVDALVGRGQVLRPRRRQHRVQALGHVPALLEPQPHLRVDFAELGVDSRQQRLVVAAAQPDQVLERVEARLPRLQPPTQVLEVEVVLQRGLEVVRRHQLGQVVGLGRVRQRAQADDPVLVLVDLLADQRLQEAAVADALDRGVDAADLPVVHLERVAVEHRRAAVHVEFGIRVRYGEHRLLHGRVGRIALHEDVPGHQGAVVVAGVGLGPAGAQQRLVRERAFEPDAVERLARTLEVVRVEQQRAEHQVRLVADRLGRGVGRLDQAGLVELRDRGGLAPVLQQRDTEVVRREPRQVVRALQRLERRDGVVRPPGGHVDVGAQELDVVLDRRGHLALDPGERVQRVVELALLEVDPRESVGGFVAHLVRDVGLEHRLDRAAGPVVHPVVELEVTDVELGVADVEVQRVEPRLVEAVVLAEFRVEPLERVEELSLV
jgi:hypothetical protein